MASDSGSDSRWGPLPPRAPRGDVDEYQPYVPVVSIHNARNGRRPRRAPEKETAVRNSCRVTPIENGCVAAGGYHTAVVDEDGNLFTWGCGLSGQLGIGNETELSLTGIETLDRVLPSQVEQFSLDYRAVQVSCGTHHTAVVSEDGRCWTFGAYAAYLGHKTTNHQQDVRIPIPVALPFDVRVIQVAAGWTHTVAVTEAGEVYTWGSGAEGRLGHADGNDHPIPKKVKGLEHDKISRCAAGAAHTVLLSGLGLVYTCGRALACGHGTVTEVPVPKAIESVRGLCRFVSAAAGAAHTALLSEFGEVVVFGWNASGQLGTGDREDVLHPRVHPFMRHGEQCKRVACGAYHTMLVFAGGELVTFGAGGPSPGDEEVTMATAYDEHPSVSAERGRLCAPLNRSGEDALDDHDEADKVPDGEDNGDRLRPLVSTGPWRLRSYSKTVHVAGGGYHSVVVSEAGEVFTCGMGDNGRLGHGSTDGLFTPVLVQSLKAKLPVYLAKERVRLFNKVLEPNTVMGDKNPEGHLYLFATPRFLADAEVEDMERKTKLTQISRAVKSFDNDSDDDSDDEFLAITEGSPHRSPFASRPASRPQPDPQSSGLN